MYEWDIWLGSILARDKRVSGLMKLARDNSSNVNGPAGSPAY